MTKSFSRILVVGPTGSGKSRLAAVLAREGGLTHVELDLLRYERDWQEVSIEDFREQVAIIVNGNSWIIDGNYAAVRDLTWKRADLVVWLDYSLPVILWRLLYRTARRLATGESVGNENREQFRRVFGRRSIILWAIRSYFPLRKEYEIAVSELRSNSTHVLRHRSPKETSTWLRSIELPVSEIRDGEGAVPGLSWRTPKCQPENRI